MLYPRNKVNLILLNLRRKYTTWDTLKNTEEEEKWVLKKEELVKEIRENNKFSKILILNAI